MTDHQISTLLRDSTSGLEPDVLDLVAGGVARGRRSRRRRRLGSALAATCVAGGLVVAANFDAGTNSLDGQVADHSGSDRAVTKPAPPRKQREPGPDAALRVAAAEVPAAFATMLPAGDVSTALDEAPYPLVDEPDRTITHFRYDGMLTTFIIDRASTMGSCQEQAAGDANCTKIDGLEVLRFGPTTADQVTAQGVSVWQHGYIVTALSYNAAEGKDVEPLAANPPIGIDQLVAVASSPTWFSWELAK